MNFDKQAQGSLVGQASKYIRTEECSPPAPISPVDNQLQRLNAQCVTLGDLIDHLINKTQSVLSGDPRQLAESASPEPAFSCPLEGNLIDLSDKLTRHGLLLQAAIQRIQL